MLGGLVARRSSTGSTSPTAKKCFQRRLTIAAAKAGLSGETIHSARDSRGSAPAAIPATRRSSPCGGSCRPVRGCVAVTAALLAFSISPASCSICFPLASIAAGSAGCPPSPLGVMSFASSCSTPPFCRSRSRCCRDPTRSSVAPSAGGRRSRATREKKAVKW